jgi:zinc transporter ZupT
LERCFNYVAHRFLDERGDSVPMVQQRLLDATIEDVEGGTSFEPVEAPARRHYDEIDDEDEFDDERLALRLSKAEPASSLRSGLLIAFILAIHNFPEGLAVGLASLMNTRKTLLMVLAISLHNIPEGIAVACPIYAASGDRGKAILFATLSGLTEPLGALLSVLVLRPWLTFQRLEAAMLFVAGVMVTVSARELLPKAWRLHARSCVLGFLFGVAAMALGIFLFAEH